MDQERKRQRTACSISRKQQSLDRRHLGLEHSLQETMTTILDDDLTTLCRGCMTNIREKKFATEDKTTQFIYDLPEGFDTNERILDLLLKSIPNISIEPFDDLPKELCLKCVTRLVEIHAFQEMFLRSQDIMLEMIKKGKTNQRTHASFTSYTLRDDMNAEKSKDGFTNNDDSIESLTFGMKDQAHPNEEEVFNQFDKKPEELFSSENSQESIEIKVENEQLQPQYFNFLESPQPNNFFQTDCFLNKQKPQGDLAKLNFHSTSSFPKPTTPSSSMEKTSVYDSHFSMIRSLMKQQQHLLRAPVYNQFPFEHVLTMREEKKAGKILRKQCKSCYSQGKRKDTIYVCKFCEGSPGYCLDCAKIIHI